MPYTLDVADLLLTKLQVVEQNEKDVHDITYLLAGFPVGRGTSRARSASSAWARSSARTGGGGGRSRATWTASCELLSGDLARLVPPDPPSTRSTRPGRSGLNATPLPRRLKWKLRSKVGERARWYELPEEVAH